jgi:hypothetical protein
MTVTHQATDEARAHAPEADHAELHRVAACHIGLPEVIDSIKGPSG